MYGTDRRFDMHDISSCTTAGGVIHTMQLVCAAAPGGPLHIRDTHSVHFFMSLCRFCKSSPHFTAHVQVLDDPNMRTGVMYDMLQLMVMLTNSWGARRFVEAGVLPVLMRVAKVEPSGAQEMEVTMDIKAAVGEVFNRWVNCVCM